jgi:two-component system, LytTR family, response regulator
MINCIIVDDEVHAIEVLQHHIKSIAQLNLIATFTNPAEAVTFLNGQPVDLILLDIHMPKISGIEFIQMVRHLNCHFILTTAYREFAADGFDLDVIDYLIKPISLNRFLQAFTKAQRVISSLKTNLIEDSIDTDYFMVKTQTKGSMIKINLSDIDYIEGMKNYVAFHHNGLRTVALMTMKEIEEKLPKKYFIRVQKSFIIALNKVTALNGNRVLLKNITSEILIGETYKQHFLERINKNVIQ